jgi:hypothetical protein
MPRLALPLLAVLVAVLALPAQAQVRRCVDAQGNSVFTDRACSSLDATPRGVPADPDGAFLSGDGLARRGCAIGPKQLLDEVRIALESRDVNRLASHYHWPGTGSGAATSLMGELEAIALRPLVAIDLVFPTPVESEADAGLPPPDRSDATPGPDQAVAAAVPPRLPAPVAIRVEQTGGTHDAGSRQTLFQLRRHAGCWWIEL